MKNAWFQESSFIYDKRSIAGRGYEIKAVLLVTLPKRKSLSLKKKQKKREHNIEEESVWASINKHI